MNNGQWTMGINGQRKVESGKWKVESGKWKGADDGELKIENGK
jgi:hypothetical protein